MHLLHLSLTNTRNYTRLELDLPARVHVLQGDNAQGKTNLLEAIYYLATTKSPLASSDRELIAWDVLGEVIPHASLAARYARAGAEHTLETILVLEREPGEPLEKAALRRQTCADGVPHRAIDIVGRLNAVLFLPEDIALISDGPGERRRYLDVTLCQMDGTYCRNLARYNRVITQRNALLRAVREGRAQRGELHYWDAQMTQLGAAVMARRLWAVAALGRHCTTIHPALTGQQEELRLEYVPSLAEWLQGPAEALDEGGWEQAFQRGLAAVQRQELARAVSVLGPHRDDVRFLVHGADMTTYGSRGQQRTIALALKLAEVALMHEQTGEMPVLLLDDVLSELDRRRSQYLLETLGTAQQVLMTTTTFNDYPRTFLERAIRWQVRQGALEQAADDAGQAAS